MKMIWMKIICTSIFGSRFLFFLQIPAQLTKLKGDLQSEDEAFRAPSAEQIGQLRVATAGKKNTREQVVMKSFNHGQSTCNFMKYLFDLM